MFSNKQLFFQSWISKLLMWIFILVLLPAIVEEMFALNDFLSKPLDFLVQW
ncbi:MAG: hypothetical protein K0R28_7146, partial [Paenibacillus sp.]|nr:hypothetical protein [Paenibacillus sp.]